MLNDTFKAKIISVSLLFFSMLLNGWHHTKAEVTEFRVYRVIFKNSILGTNICL